MSDYYAIAAGTAGVSANLCYHVLASATPAASTSPALTYALGTCSTQPAAASASPAVYNQDYVDGQTCTASTTVTCKYYLGYIGTKTSGTTVGTSETVSRINIWSNGTSGMLCK